MFFAVKDRNIVMSGNGNRRGCLCNLQSDRIRNLGREFIISYANANKLVADIRLRRCGCGPCRPGASVRILNAVFYSCLNTVLKFYSNRMAFLVISADIPG